MNERIIKMTSVISVAYCFDSLYFRPMVVSLISLLKNLNSKYTLQVFAVHDYEIEASEKEEVCSFIKKNNDVSINFINIKHTDIKTLYLHGKRKV